MTSKSENPRKKNYPYIVWQHSDTGRWFVSREGIGSAATSAKGYPTADKAEASAWKLAQQRGDKDPVVEIERTKNAGRSKGKASRTTLEQRLAHVAEMKAARDAWKVPESVRKSRPKYVFIEYTQPDGTYYGANHPDDHVPQILAALRDRGVKTVWIDEKETMTTSIQNPEIRSKRGKLRGAKYPTQVSDRVISKGLPFVVYDTGRYEGEIVWIVNPLEVEDRRNKITIFQIGAVGTIWLAVLNKSDEDGFEEAAAWLADHAPGEIMDHGSKELKVLYEEALAELVEAGEDPEDEETQLQAMENATADLTYTESGYVTSYEWAMIKPDATLESQIINKSKNIYRKEYGEDPYARPEPPKYGRYGRRSRNPEAPHAGPITSSDPGVSLASRLARGEHR